jgi:hypothetical protein
LNEQWAIKEIRGNKKIPRKKESENTTYQNLCDIAKVMLTE